MADNKTIDDKIDPYDLSTRKPRSFVDEGEGVNPYDLGQIRAYMNRFRETKKSSYRISRDP